MRLSDWLSCEVIGSFLRQFPQKHRVEAARCACRIGVTCLWGWTTSQKQWSLEDLLEATASINPAANGGGTRTASPRQVARRQEVVAQPWAAARAPEARAPYAESHRVSSRAQPSGSTSSMPVWANGGSSGGSQGRGAIKSPQRHGSEETLSQRQTRSPTQSAQRIPVRTLPGTGPQSAPRRRGTSQDSGHGPMATMASAPGSAKDLHGIHPDGSTASLPEARGHRSQARPLVTFTTGASQPRRPMPTQPMGSTGPGPTVPWTRVQRVVQAAASSPSSGNSGHRGRNGYRRIGQSQSPDGHSASRERQPSGSPGTPRGESHEPNVGPNLGFSGGRILAPTTTAGPRVTTQAPLKRHTLGGPFARRN